MPSIELLRTVSSPVSKTRTRRFYLAIGERSLAASGKRRITALSPHLGAGLKPPRSILGDSARCFSAGYCRTHQNGMSSPSWLWSSSARARRRQP